MNELALFAGAGGGILGGKLLGWRTVAAVEVSAYCSRRLMQRQNEGHLPPFPIWDDVCTFNARSWRGLVDVVSGGFPCTDISAIKRNALGLDGKHSGLWFEMARVVRESEPRFVFIENSPLLVRRGLVTVLNDLAAMGYDARWGVIGADDAGFPIHRKRLWVVGESRRTRLEGHPGHVAHQGERPAPARPVAEAGLRLSGWKRVVYSSDCDDSGLCPVCGNDFSDCGCPGPTMDECQYGEWGGIMHARGKHRFIEPGLGRVAGRAPNRVDRLTAIGNIQVPDVASLAWQLLR